jgi:hypoxanthine phosphoribosyltransferase
MSLIFRKAFSAEQIDKEIGRLADEITRDYADKELLVIVVLKGAFIFAADLLRKLNVPLMVDFIELASYSGMNSSGTVTITKDLTTDIRGRHALIVEDIIDEGVSLSFLVDTIRGRSPASLKICTLIDNKRRRSVALEPEYAGFRCSCGFLVGYGLDMDQRYRELPDLHEIVPSELKHDVC